MKLLKNLFLKWRAFFSPVPDWWERYRAFRSGTNQWEVPGKPDRPKVVPFPVQWIPHRLVLSEADSEAAWARGFEFEEAICADTGKPCGVGLVVACLRCGVPLHPEAAHMFGGFDPPYCKRCKWVIRLKS